MRKQYYIYRHKPIYTINESLDPNLKVKNLNKL